MKALVLVALSLTLAAPAHGQNRGTITYPSARDIQAAGDSQQTQAAYRSRDVMDQFAYLEERAGRLQCLREKRSGELVCRTRAQWQRIAARIENGQRWRN